MRLFLAIDLAPEVRASLEAIPSGVDLGAADVRWSTSGNLHCTVLFLGEHDPVALPGIEEACVAVAAETAPFRIAVRGASVFPKQGPVKTLFVGLGEGASEWKALVRRAEPWFVPMGVARNGGLVPHVTLGRVRSGGDDPRVRAGWSELSDRSFGEQAAEGMVLVRSDLDRSGATYHNVGFYPFKGVAG
ncbi:MAG: RNA 2',3'-cyclic phosphodiesterase [Armatimonadota bacterium]